MTKPCSEARAELMAANPKTMMQSTATIVVTLDGNEIGSHSLEKRNLMIGRRKDCDIHLNSGKVSRLHAQIFSVLDETYVLDLESKNGTFVNSQRIKKHALKEGDIIRIGSHELKFIFSDESTE